MAAIGPTPARRRVLELVRRLGPVTPPELGAAMETSAVAARQHLAALEAEGLVASMTVPTTGRGRPPAGWIVTETARRHLPDAHAELTVGLIDAIESGVGARGLERVLAARADQQVEAYRRSVGTDKPIASRVKAMASVRTREGYMAEARRAGSDWLLIEHHCPICDAARRCRGLCGAELDVFRRVLGDDVSVERVEHVLEDGARCVYRVAPR